MVPQSWIIDCLKMFQISGKVIKFIKNTMGNSRVKQTAGGKSLAEVKIQEGILQGDALSPLLFEFLSMLTFRKTLSNYTLILANLRIQAKNSCSLLKTTRNKPYSL